MKGVGGPLLCIGDLLSDVGEQDTAGDHPHSHFSSISAAPTTDLKFPPARLLPNLFQENYDRLNEALSGTDHSWTALTLEVLQVFDELDKWRVHDENNKKTPSCYFVYIVSYQLCNALETANNLVQSTNAHVGVLSNQIEELEKIIKRGDSVVEAAKFIHNSPSEAQNSRQSMPDHQQS